MLNLSVSTWSLHRTLGKPAMFGPADAPVDEPNSDAAHALLTLPAQLAAFGIRTLELCHFHVRSTDAAYLAALKQSLGDAGVTLHCLLIDAGDLTHAEHAVRDEAWIARWVDVAAALGAKTARVIAGMAEPSDAALAQSAAALSRLAAFAAARGVRVVIENFYATTGTPSAVHALLAQSQGDIGFKLDFGNWRGPGKYELLAEIASLAESVHAKASFTGPYQPAADDYTRCLQMMRDVNFSGPCTLIYDDASGPDEFRGLAAERELAVAVL
jgi:sugar phosphate isomerase/epimerase